MTSKPNVWATLCVALAATATARSACADEPASRGPFRIVGYLPEYRMREFNPEAAQQLTDLIIFSVEPSAGGELDLRRLKDAPWAKFRELKDRQHVRLILCAGGWGRSAHFPAVAADDAKRRKFVESAVKTCRTEQLDGLDLDWEHPKNAAEEAGYARLLADLREAFEPLGLKLSVTMAAWQKLPAEAFAAVDWVQLMSYDHEGKHSTLEGAQADVKSVLDRGVPPGKIALEVPFYGRHVQRRNREMSYAQIVSKYHPGPEVDEVDGYYFNGPATIRRKTEYALESKLGGIMFWELGQDAPGDASLVRGIRDATERR